MKTIFFKDQDLKFINDLDQITVETKKLKEEVMKLDPCSGSVTGYSMKIPESFVSSLDNNVFVRIMTQFIPSESENTDNSLSSLDPLCESKFEVYPRVLKKYQSRVLVHLTNDCFCNCRFCFRRFTRRMSDDCSSQRIFTPNEYLRWLEGVVSFIDSDKSIKEVILSGGDPLILSDEVLEHILDQLVEIQHLSTIRIHTRSLCVYPDRFTKELEKIIKKNQKKKNLVLVFHVNHEAECNESMKKMASMILCYSQTVLLKNVNDDAEILSNLFYKLISYKITPYYLHTLDHVKGAMHFEVDQNIGLDLLENLRQTLPGYVIPRYVKETVDAPYKTIIG